MKGSVRRQVKTPVGNKTKRGAELEGTPKTPRPFEISPVRSACVDGSSQEQEDRSLQPKSRRPLHWNNIAKQGFAIAGGGNEDSLENPLTPSHQQEIFRGSGEARAAEIVAALSPICVNAIAAGIDQQGERKAGMKKLTQLPSKLLLQQNFSPMMEGCGAAVPRRKGHGNALDAEWGKKANKEQEDAGSWDGSYPSSPDWRTSPFSGGPAKRVFFWSNAAFNQRSVLNEMICESKDTSSSSGCSSSSSGSQQDAQLAEPSVCQETCKETENYPSDEESCPVTEGSGSSHGDGSFKEICNVQENVIVSQTNGRGHTIQESNLELLGQLGLAKDEMKDENAWRGGRDLAENSSVARKVLFRIDESALNEAQDGKKSASKRDSDGVGDFQRSGIRDFKATDESEKSGQGHGEKEGGYGQKLEIGMDEIEQEIKRLTLRLTELQLQKRKREEEMMKREEEEERGKKAAAMGVSSEEGRKKGTEGDKSVAAKLLQRQGKRATAGAGRGGGSAAVLQSPRAQPQKSFGAASKSREDSPLAPATRRVAPPAVSLSKLSELRRSVSSAKRAESGGSDANAERAKVLRRLSLSSAAVGTAARGQHEQQQQRSLTPRGTPARVVSSRYGRATTPDACRPRGHSSASVCKKRDRASSATSSPLPQPPAATFAASPLKKIATVRSGYPSRSGFVTPTKDCLKASTTTAVPTSGSANPPPSDLLSSSGKSRLGTTKASRLDSPKSTAALYQCLESLVEDSKHFFKRLSPARKAAPHLNQVMLQLDAHAGTSAAPLPAGLASSSKLPLALERGTLPTINTCRLAALSPRDSGCVKRTSDRQKKQFFFAKEEIISRPHES